MLHPQWDPSSTPSLLELHWCEVQYSNSSEWMLCWVKAGLNVPCFHSFSALWNKMSTDGLEDERFLNDISAWFVWHLDIKACIFPTPVSIKSSQHANYWQQKGILQVFTLQESIARAEATPSDQSSFNGHIKHPCLRRVAHQITVKIVSSNQVFSSQSMCAATLNFEFLFLREAGILIGVVLMFHKQTYRSTSQTSDIFFKEVVPSSYGRVLISGEQVTSLKMTSRPRLKVRLQQK